MSNSTNLGRIAILIDSKGWISDQYDFLSNETNDGGSTRTIMNPTLSSLNRIISFANATHLASGRGIWIYKEDNISLTANHHKIDCKKFEIIINSS